MGHVSVTDVSQESADQLAAGRSSSARKSWLSRLSVVRQLVSYGVNGLLTTAVYSAVVWTLLAVSHKTFALDVLIAYGIAVICNYLGSRYIFRPTTNLHGHLFRYVTVVAGNVVLTALGAWLLRQWEAPDFVAAYVPVWAVTIPSFGLLRVWVFRSPTDPA
jgi:putative flippase GtrA